MRSPDLGSAESTSTITGSMEGVLLGCSDAGKTKFTPYRYRLGDSRGHCEIHQEISQILKNPVTSGISHGMADGPALRSKSMGQ